MKIECKHFNLKHLNALVNECEKFYLSLNVFDLAWNMALMYADFCILLKRLGLVRMFVGSVLVNPHKTITHPLKTSKDLKVCVTC